MITPWPTPESHQVEVMILGSYHMDNPGLDSVNIDADDVLTPTRQAELRALVERLSDWQPDGIALERPFDSIEAVNERYDEYRIGERQYDREERFSSPHSMRDGTTTECRSEVVQIGFRLADALGHDRVRAVDEHPDRSRYADDPFWERAVESDRKTATELPSPDAVVDQWGRQLAENTIPAYLAWLNHESQLRFNHDHMFDSGIRSTGDGFGSPLALVNWYDRNLRMVHHCWRTLNAGDERLLFIVGNGHVRVLRHLFEEAPMFCPVSPLEYLPTHTRETRKR
ncbi:DUF5694 domain-containing protein [Natronosalvus caseinilyticus]|uniref:DUF5694 domain-containing protein n=1 Tax=Natronosalvus caseinilyticus TaxID=2953747 RepID=UPI0028A8EE1D|nr:DUF5694 domain-containing protein [Natronosalvus caseinilyticus]